MNRPRYADLIVFSVITVLVFIAGCSDSNDPVEPPVPVPTVYGGPDNPASDGSFTAEIVSANGIAALETVPLGGIDPRYTHRTRSPRVAPCIHRDRSGRQC